MANRGEQFRALHEKSGAFIMPNPWDVGSARILTAMGFKALATTSAGMAFALGKCDGQVSREEALRHCREIVAATPLPVSADLENGYGDTPECVFETVSLAAATGLAGCSIEDHTGDPNQPIYDFTLSVERIAAACEACRALPEDFVLTARCEQLLWGRSDLDGVIARLQAYETAGADVLFAPGLRDLSAIREVCAALGKPVNVVTEDPTATFSVDELAGAGVKRISVGSALAQLAYGSLISAARDIALRRSFEFTGEAIGFSELDAFFKPIGGN